MARSRRELNDKLIAILGTENVYYNPPESVKMKYDAIVYSPAKASTVKADNRRYFKMKQYDGLIISRNPELELVEDFDTYFEFCDMGKPYTADNLWHWPFTIFY